jgi:hypothetical protein
MAIIAATRGIRSFLALSRRFNNPQAPRPRKSHARKRDVAALVGGEECLRADREADGFEPFAAESEHGDVT